MKIIIIGDGKVGHSLAKSLSEQRHDVTIIDKDRDVLKKDMQDLDVQCIKGNGVSTSTLLEAGVDIADVLIAATSRDEINMVCCLTAKKLGVGYTIARIRDTEYANELTVLKDQLDLDLIINPEQTAAYEIARIFSFPNAHSVESFYRGRVTMVGINISDNDAVAGMKISDVAKKYGYSFIVCAVERGSEIFIPGGKFIVQGGDILYLMGHYAKVNKFCNLIEDQVHRIKDVMIMGGGRIAYYLVEAIKDMSIKVKIIEEDKERCIELTELLPNVLVINGDGTDETVLESENLDKMDAFVALTGWDEDNLMTSLYAKRAGVPKVIAKITKVNYSSVIKDLGISAVIDSKKLTTNLIVRYINGLKKERDSNIETIYPILEGRAQVLVYRVVKGMDFIGTPIKSLDLGDEMVIGAIIRHNDILYPDGDEIIEIGDKIIAVSKDEEYDYDDDLFDGE